MGPFGVRVTEVSQPSKIIEMADAMAHSIDRTSADTYAGEVEPSSGQFKATAYRHRGKANVLFFDGHVETLSREVLTNPQTNETLWIIQ